MPYGGSLLLPLQAFAEDAFPSTLPQEVDERFSTLLQQMLPQFVVDDHPLFVAFLRAYCEYSEQYGNPRAEAVRMNEYVDVDKTLPEFLEYFKSQYLYDFPVDLYKDLNEEQVIKNIKNYYGEKGNPRSLDLLFRIVYNTNVEVKFPREQVIVASESGYEQRTSVNTTRFNGDKLLSFVGNKLVQEPENDRPDLGLRATAFVDSIEFREYDGIDYAEVKLRDQFGTFSPNRKILFVNEDNQRLEEEIFGVITTALPQVIGGVTQDGQNYRVGDTVIVRDTSQRIIANMKINDVSSTGEIQRLTNANSNKIYFADRTYTFEIQTAGGTGASLEIVGDTSEILPDNLFLNEKSILSANSFLQNNFNYQEFSYVISSDIQLASYAKFVKTLFHPAGSMLLGEFVFRQNFDSAGLTTDIRTQPNIPILAAVIGNYFPYTIATTADLRGDTYGLTFGDYYPTGFDGITAHAATFGNFDANGNAITHDPFDIFGLGNVPTGATLYGVSEFSPEFLEEISDGDTTPESRILPGYTVAAFPQVRMVQNDNAASEYYIVAKHPNALLGINQTARAVSSINKNYTKQTTGDKVDQQVQRVRFTIAASVDGTGAVTTLTVGDTITQNQGNSPAARGTIVAIEQVNEPEAPPKGGSGPVFGTSPFDQVTVLTVDVLNGSFVNTTTKNLLTGEATQVYSVTNQAGVRFFIAGQDGADTQSVSESNTNLSFGNVRIQDFFDRLQVPVYD